MAIQLAPVGNPDQQRNNLSINDELGRLNRSGAFGAAPASPAQGQLWYDTVNSQLKLWNGSAWVILSTGGTVTSIVAGTGLTGGTITTTGTIAIDSTVATLTGTQALTNKDLTGTGNTFPTFNQNTTGSAAKWTTARNLAGNSVDGSANVAFANKFIIQGTTDAGLTGAQFLGALGTGILKNTTTTGVLSIAVAGDFPTLNQSTTGSAATLTTARTIAGVSFDGSANISIPHANLTSLSADDHTQYALLAGRSGGQTLKGGTAASENLNFSSTNHATKGFILGDASLVGLGGVTTPMASKQLSISSNTVSPSHAATGKGVLVEDATAVGFYARESANTVDAKFEALTATVGIGSISNHDVVFYANNAEVLRLTAALGGVKIGSSSGAVAATSGNLSVGTLGVGNGGSGAATFTAGYLKSPGTTSAFTTVASIPAADITAAAWTSYTPTWTGSSANPALGNGTIVGRYMQIGKTVFFSIVLTMGSSTTYGTGTWSFTLPITKSSSAPARDPLGQAECLQTGTASFPGQSISFTTTTTDVQVYKTGGTYTNGAQITSAIPFTWGNTHVLSLQGTYEAA